VLKIDHEKCTLCKLCIKNCPFGALSIVDGLLSVNEACTLCGACVNVCRFDALSIARRQASPEELAAYRGVFIWVELEELNGQIQPRKVSLELLGKGRKLADQLSQELIAVVLGGEDLPDMSNLGDYGADLVIIGQHALLAEYSTDGFTQVLSALISGRKPSIVLYGATPHGRDLAPRVAARLKLGLTADCTGLEIDGQGQLVQTRPAFGGNIMASIITPYTRPQTATVRPNVFEVPEKDSHLNARTEFYPVVLSRSAIRTKVIERHYVDNAAGENIADAKVIVSGGRGCQKPENLGLLKHLADQLGGMLAGSRPIVEQGWIPHTMQVGQSGTTVGPQLYIAAGISGAIQHIVGMSSSKAIVAINKDPEAPILQVADLGVVGDALEIIPALTALIEQQEENNKN
jgi:electron transfer flavoprotein alpha subunit